MEVGDLVKMDFEAHGVIGGDVWGVGMILEISEHPTYSVHVLWPGVGLSWEMMGMLDVVNESR